MKANLLILMLACSRGPLLRPPARAAAEAATVADIAEQAAAVQATAHDLTSQDESRRQSPTVAPHRKRKSRRCVS